MMGEMLGGGAACGWEMGAGLEGTKGLGDGEGWSGVFSGDSDRVARRKQVSGGLGRGRW